MRQTLFEMVRQASTRFGDKPFTFKKTDSGWVSKTFNQSFHESRCFAAFLLERGYSLEDRVAIYAEGSPNWIVGEYGIIMAGMIAVPLSFKLLPEEIYYRLDHSEARMVLTNANHLEKICRVAQDIQTKTGRSIDVVSLDEDQDLSTSTYPRNQLFRIDEVLAQGAAVLEKHRPRLDTIEAECSEDRVVTISYTSGTTGNPKGIMLTHKNYYINSLDSVNIFKVPETGYRNFVILPVDHSFAQTVGIHASIQRGIELWFVDSRGGGMAILRNIPINMKEAEPVFLMTVPALSGNFMKKMQAEIDKRGGIIKFLFDTGIKAGISYWGDGSFPERNLKTFLNALVYFPLKKLVLDKVKTEVFGKRAQFFTGGGASFDIGQQRFYRALGMPLYQGYGMTEASPVISTNIEGHTKLGTSGIALDHVEIRIIRDDGTFAEPGEKGEICVRGPNVMKGYFKNPEATRETLVDGWLHTGDLGWLDKDGYLTVAGRAKALLISADGEKYSPEGIEEAIANSAKVVNQVMVWNDHKRFTCALITLEDEQVKKLIKEHHPKTREALLELIKASFYSFRSDPSYKNMVPLNWTPATFQIVPEAFSEKDGLINSTMKLVRYKVVEKYSELIEYIYSEGSSYKNNRNLEALSKYL
ncbi:AMP-dependent synthetase/ligase [Gracilinema caldarium]|uniref:Long-chain-fatty-acid--CoA ligase n=1 Tax=Gracilinema caldarium (strain ATCC 51460 / DSM 7334 / H1) TaxID=744872 RepID=F8F3B3_GRAC1|nr:AMP-binding protein [Gracilinema caldarium]AEJ20950.1 Long-chain-fatty-acid--CoA ligase [Gracilinema caldarium DSM 7334]